MNEDNQNTEQEISLESQQSSPALLRRSWLSRGIFSLVIFTSGIIVCVALTLEHIRQSMAATQNETVENKIQINPDKSTAYVMKKFKERYTLTENQQTKIENIVREHFIRTGIRRHQLYTEFRNETKQFGTNISEQLTEERKKDWDSSYSKLRYSFFTRRSHRKHSHKRSHHWGKSKHSDKENQKNKKSEEKVPQPKSKN